MATKKTAKKVAASKKASEAAIFAKRSKAAKKGWRKRRKAGTSQKKAIANVNKKLRKSKKELSPELRKLIPTKKEIDALSLEDMKKLVVKQAKRLAGVIDTDDWVDAMPEEYLNRDRTVALMPSRARHMGVDTDIMYDALNDAYGTELFDGLAYEFAEEFDLPVQEIYTLFFSP